MKKILTILAIGLFYTISAQTGEEYIDGRLVKHQTFDGISVSTSLQSIQRNDGKYYTFNVSITNGNERAVTVKPSAFEAALNTRKGLIRVPVLTRKEYLKIKKRRENLRVGLKAFAGAIAAHNAGYSNSNTYSSGTVRGRSNTRGNANVNGRYGQKLGSVGYNSTTNSSASYSGSSHTTSYSGAAAYAAQQNESAKLAAFQEASAYARTAWNNAYIKNNTLSQYESMNGILNVKFKKSNMCILVINVEGVEFEFNWNPYDAEN